MNIRLKDYYMEAELKGANALIMDYRLRAINAVLDEQYLNDENSIILGKWLMGEVQEDTETILEDIEKFFCKEDESFCRDDDKEMKVLSTVLLLDYCESSEDKKIPLMLLCGRSIGKKLLCPSLYREFRKLIDDTRLEARNCEEIQKSTYKNSGFQSLKKEIADAKKEQAEENFDYNTELLDKLLQVIESQDANMKKLQKNNEQLKKCVICQREESNILWWMNGKWSLIYQKSFTDMDAEELAIAIPLELRRFSSFPLLPYSAESIIGAIIRENATQSDNIPFLNYAKKINDSVIKELNAVIGADNITNVQPVLGLIKSMKECGAEPTVLKSLMLRNYNINIEDIELTPMELARHFCLELELADNL